MIYAEDAENITITGRGPIDGQGQPWWQPILDAKSRGKGAGGAPALASSSAATERPQLIRLVRCRDVVIEKINLTDKGPALLQRNCNAVDTTRLRTTTPHPGVAVVVAEAAPSP